MKKNNNNTSITPITKGYNHGTFSSASKDIIKNIYKLKINNPYKISYLNSSIGSYSKNADANFSNYNPENIKKSKNSFSINKRFIEMMNLNPFHGHAPISNKNQGSIKKSTNIKSPNSHINNNKNNWNSFSSLTSISNQSKMQKDSSIFSLSDIQFGITIGIGLLSIVKICTFHKFPGKYFALKIYDKQLIINSKQQNQVYKEKTILNLIKGHPFLINLYNK